MKILRMPQPDRSTLFVTVQFACLAVIALTGPVVARNPFCLATEIGACMLGWWSVFSLRLGNFQIRPEVRAGAHFVQRGPYRRIRHPMYTAVLGASLALAIDSPGTVRWIAWGILLADLAAKMRYEETLLVNRFPEYAAYRAATKRLIPYLY